jgi:hypothetical protein
MDHPLIIAALLLAGVSVAGLFIDVRAVARRATRAFGASALAIKGVLAVGFVLQIFHVRTLPVSVYEQFGDYVTFFALVTVGVPLVAVAIACELVSLPRLTGRRAVVVAVGVWGHGRLLLQLGRFVYDRLFLFRFLLRRRGGGGGRRRRARRRRGGGSGPFVLLLVFTAAYLSCFQQKL